MTDVTNAGTILVAGAINTDLVATVDRAPDAGETITGRGFAIFSGGKGANQAVAARRSGAPVAMLGAVGRDDFGSARIADLQRDGIVTYWVARTTEASSGVALILVETDGENRIAYVPGATATVEPAHCLRAFEAVTPRLLLAANELRLACLRGLFSAAQRASVPVVLNAAPDPEKARSLLPMVDVLIVNRGEAQALIGGANDEEDPESLIAGLRDCGAKSVVITLGEQGVVGMDDGQPFHQAASRVDVVDTTGAGDAFCGALAACLARGLPLADAVRYGVAAGSLAATRAGAQASIPTREDIEQFISEPSNL